VDINLAKNLEGDEEDDNWQRYQ
jgi:hypothetical protein